MPGMMRFWSPLGGGSFSLFYSSYFEPCAPQNACDSLSVLPVSEFTEEIGGQTYSYSYFNLADLLNSNGELPVGYIYVVFQGNGTLCDEGELYFDFARIFTCSASDCEECVPPFTPELNKEYIVNAWAKEENAPATAVTYSAPYLSLRNLGLTGAIISADEVLPSGPIIDGWQRMEGSFNMDASAAQVQVFFGTNGGPVVFDDVRIFPADGSMKCYVYDPVTLRFVAELDERHFATFYEYDNEGNLVRVKKETERGIKTLKETRQNAPHFEVQ